METVIQKKGSVSGKNSFHPIVDDKLRRLQDHYNNRFQELLQTVLRYSKNANVELITKAFEFSLYAHRNQLRKSGDPYFEHCFNVAVILADLKMDFVTIIGGLLHDVVEDTGITIEQVAEEFGEEIANLVDGVTKISELKFDSVEAEQAENFRKMLLSMAKDIRVILIKFADRLHNMRTLDYLPAKKRDRIAIETRDVYAPLAHRFGIAKIRWELEDLALKTLDSKAYRDLEEKIDTRRAEREKYIRKISDPLIVELKKHSIEAEITGRPKHFASIYNKMQRRRKPFEEIYDLFAIRLIVKKLEECYFTLGIVHSMFMPVYDRFKDYIAMPKMNGYQSLHTTVIGPDGKMVEIQIRTDAMHKTAEEGIAAHWRYKEGKDEEDELDKQLAWLRQLIDQQIELKDPSEFMENLKIDLFQDEVFVFTPKGDLIKLPKNSSPVDFAYAVHSKVGSQCIGAKVNGRIVALNSSLKSGDLVEIITSANQKPHADWLKFVRTTKARHHIRRFQREAQFEQSIRLGEEILQKTFKKYGIKFTGDDLAGVAQSLNFSDLKHLHASLGQGDTSIQSVLRKIYPEGEPKQKQENLFTKFIRRVKDSSGVRVQGMGNMMITFGKCCQPVPGDEIIGFVTKGKGLAIHRNDCRNAVKYMQFPERMIEVKWDVEPDKRFMVKIRMMGEDRVNFLRDITASLSSAETNIVNMVLKTRDGLMTATLLIEVKNLQHLTKVVNAVSKVKGIVNVERMDGMNLKPPVTPSV